MDHMRILGNEPSSVILSQTKKFKILEKKTGAKKCKNNVTPKRMV